ncbi:MAG: hypothetical protein K8H88_20780, partial [Sandaracinaceae bacterium]|nr:hypothetical protein [Sandaracinaceae bacterium]
MRNLKGASTPNVQAMKALQDRITATKQSVAQAQGKVLELGGGLGTLKRAGAGSSAGLKELLSTAQGMPGPLGGLASKLGAIRGLVAGGGAIAAGVLAIAAALVALVAAAGAATVALLRYGIAQADARRSELLRLEGLTTIRRHYYLAAGNATAMQAAIDRVSASVALGRGELVGYTQQLYRMGLRGQALEDALQGMATVASVQGEEQARRFAGMAAGAARAGGSVRRLADLVERRLGGIAARQLLSLDVQAAKLRESFAAIFLGLRIEGFLEGLRTLTQLFSQNTATGRALKTIAEALLQPLIDDLTRLAPFARRFFQGMVIGALQLTILI